MEAESFQLISEFCTAIPIFACGYWQSEVCSVCCLYVCANN